jgi:hypothetical protein
MRTFKIAGLPGLEFVACNACGKVLLADELVRQRAQEAGEVLCLRCIESRLKQELQGGRTGRGK